MAKPSSLVVITVVTLTLLLFSAYSNTFLNPPVMDDFHSFVDEPNVQIESVSLDSLKKLSQTEFGFCRLLPMATFAGDFFWGKGHVWAFHITNFLIHLLCTAMLFAFLRILFQCADFHTGENQLSPQGDFWLIVCIVGLWSLCPVQTNAVTYLVQRMTSLATLFYLVSITFYLQARFCQRQEGFSVKAAVFYFIFTLSALGSFLSKEISATLPIVIILSEVMFFTPDLFLRIVKRKKIFYFLALIFIVIAIISVVFLLPRLSGYGGRHFTLSERLLTELRVVSSYVFLLLLPLPRFLNFEHDVALSTSLISPLSTLMSLIFISSLLFLAWKLRHRYKLVSFGIIWFFINLAIESTIIPLELKFEHRLYLPSIGFYLALVLIVKNLLNSYSSLRISAAEKKSLKVSVIFIMFAVLSGMTYARNNVWVNNFTLYSDCVRKAPGKARNHVNLARAYALSGDYDKTIEESELAIRVGQKGYEEYWAAACNIISAYIIQGDLQQAIQKGESFLTGDNIPEQAKQNAYPLVLRNLGIAYLRSGDYSAAYSFFLRAFNFMLQCDRLHNLSDFEDSLVDLLVKVYDEKDDFAGKIGLDLNDKSTVYCKIADLLYERGRLDRTLYYCEKGLNVNPAAEWCSILRQKIEYDLQANQRQLKKGTLKSKYLHSPFNSWFNFYMAMAYLQEKMNVPFFGGVQSSLDRAKALNPLSADINLLESWHLFKQKKTEAALEIIDRGIEIEPEYARLWVNRAIYAISAGHNHEALFAVNQVLKLYPGYPYRKKIEAIKKAAEMNIAENS